MLAVGEAVGNAIKHARQGSAEVGRGDDRIMVRISDGDAETLPASILQPGFSTAVSLGMGYSLMLELVDSIWVASGPQGTVRVDLPGSQDEGGPSSPRLMGRVTRFLGHDAAEAVHQAAENGPIPKSTSMRHAGKSATFCLA